MTFIKCLVASVCLILVRAEYGDPGPQLFSSNPLAVNQQQGYVTKEVTLYLTPSQIKALEASKLAEKGSAPNSKPKGYTEQELQKLDAEIKKQLESQHIYLIDPNEIQKPESSVQNQQRPVVEPSTENPLKYSPGYQQQWTPIPKTQEEQTFFVPNPEVTYQNPIKKLPESYSFVKIFTDEKVHETPKLQLFHPIPHLHQDQHDFSKLFEVRRDPINGKEYKLIPYEYLPDNSPGAPKLEDVKEIGKWIAGIDKYGTPQASNTYAIPITEDNENEEAEKKENVFNKDETQLKYAPSYDDQKHATDYENFVIRLEKENARARAEAILKSSSGQGRKDATKLRPISGNKQINPYLLTEKSSYIRHVWKH